MPEPDILASSSRFSHHYMLYSFLGLRTAAVLYTVILAKTDMLLYDISLLKSSWQLIVLGANLPVGFTAQHLAMSIRNVQLLTLESAIAACNVMGSLIGALECKLAYGVWVV